VRPGASARRAAHHMASRATRCRQFHVARLAARLVAPLVVDYSVSRRLVVDYFASAVRLVASAHRAARHADCQEAHRRLLRLRRASGCLGTSRRSSLVVDYFAYAA
jgi:hypothetical protein